MQTFKSRFAWAVCEDLLKPSGPLAGEGLKRAQQGLGGSPFGIMIERGMVDIHPNEQHAQQLRRWIQHYVNLLPKRQGGNATAPLVYYLGDTKLGSVLDVDALSCRLLCTHYQIDGVWQENEALHQALRELWRKHEAEETTSEKVEGLLEQMKQRTDALDLPISPAGQALIHREHLRKALQAALHQTQPR